VRGGRQPLLLDRPTVGRRHRRPARHEARARARDQRYAERADSRDAVRRLPDVAMVVRFVLWSLADSTTSVEDLRTYLRDEAVDAFENVPGLLFKAWVSDAIGERWGAIYLFESISASEQELPSRARELIGKEPEIVEVFDLEASVSVADQLTRLGLALDY